MFYSNNGYDDFNVEEYNDNYYSEDQDKTNAALNNLVTIYSEIYDLTFNGLMKLELNGKIGSEDFTKTINKLKLLKLKEQRILDNLEPYVEIEECPMLDVFLSEQIDDQEKRIQVKNRIGYVFTKRDLLYNNMFEESSKKEAQRRFESITELLLKFISSSSKRKLKKKSIKEKYELSYLYPEIEDEMIYTSFNPKNQIKFKAKDKAKLLNMEPEDYKIEKDAHEYDYISDLITELESNSESDINTIKLKLDIVEFGIKKLPTLDLSDLHQMCQHNLNFDNSQNINKNETVLERLCGVLRKELTKRKDYEETLQRQEELLRETEENEDMDRIPKELTDIMFDLIKQINDIFETGIELAEQEYQNKDITPKLQILEFQLEREKQLINLLTEITPQTKKHIETILNNYLYFIVATYMNAADEEEIQKRSTLIDRRIKNLLPFLTFTDYSIYKSPKVLYYINQNQLIETFKAFEEKIENSKEKRLLSITKYEELLTNPDLTDDFISNKGKINDITTLDEYTVATILDIDVEEYMYDKEETLKETANRYLQYLAQIEQTSSLDEPSKVAFQIVYVQTALKNLSTEKLEKIESDYMYMSSEFKKSVLNKNQKSKRQERKKVRRK